jgi:glutaredoxin
MPEMLKLSGGQRRVPVIVDGGKIEVGFDGHS